MKLKKTLILCALIAPLSTTVLASQNEMVLKMQRDVAEQAGKAISFAKACKWEETQENRDGWAQSRQAYTSMGGKPTDLDAARRRGEQAGQREVATLSPAQLAERCNDKPDMHGLEDVLKSLPSG